MTNIIVLESINKKAFKMLIFILFFSLVAIESANPVPETQGRVVGGKQISIEEVPYQISIRNGLRHSCGGSIISKKYVVTAAHCVSIPNIKNYRVRAGSENRDCGGSLHKIVKIMRHNVSMNADLMPVNDIALVEVNPPFEFGKRCAPISLFKLKEEAVPGSIALVSGWGKTLETSKPTYLQAVEVPIINKEECRKAYKNLPDGEICAMHILGGKDSCQGDSGGPLAINGRLAGIVSWGFGCGVIGKPGVYTEVAYYASWIEENTGI